MKYMMMMMLMSFLLNFLFLNFNNPLIMSIILIFQTILLNLMMGKIYYTFWFSYIMFLVFIGGLFILFIYIISMIYNNMIFFKKFILLMMISMMFFMLIMIYMKNNNLSFLNYETLKFNLINNFKENYLNMINFFNFPNMFINIMLIMYLFLLMIIVVKITNFLKGTIRTIN